jgi:ankyrin repeat protein
MKGFPDIVALLLAKGVDVNAKSATNSTPLHDAALGGSVEVTRLLLDKGAEIEARESESDSTPLHVAAGWGRMEVVRLLIERGARKDVKNKAGKTPAEVAVEAGYSEVAKAIVAGTSASTQH